MMVNFHVGLFPSSPVLFISLFECTAKYSILTKFDMPSYHLSHSYFSLLKPVIFIHSISFTTLTFPFRKWKTLKIRNSLQKMMDEIFAFVSNKYRFFTPLKISIALRFSLEERELLKISPAQDY